MVYIRNDAHLWSSRDDLDPMSNAQELLDAGEIDPKEEGFINGYIQAA